MHRYDLISCHDCGVLHRRRPVLPREKARCVRCRSILYRGIHSDVNRMAAITLGAIFTFLIAQFCPIVELAVGGYTSSATLSGAIRVLWTEKMQVVAVIVSLFTVVLPAVELGALLYVTLALRSGVRPHGFDHLLRAVAAARRWGMTEVLMIGILITIVKMTSLAQVVVQPGLFAFGALTLMLAIVTSFDPQMLWNIGEHLPGPRRPAQAEFRYTPHARLAACHSCGLVAQHQAATHQHCARCGAALHRRRPDSVGRTWAFLLAATILYIPANLLPVMYTHSLFGKEDDTIISGVVYFWTSGSPALAAIIFIASIVVPVLKLAALSLLALTAQRRSRWRPLQRTILYRIVEFVGRWSMLDIFVITLTVALVRFQSLATITAGPGALAFCAVVVLTMLASMQFDPRLIWDPIDSNGENHA
ncbi:paraquat-inducible protein A [Duganella sp. BJB488]|uniref:paraquat-inducible protein A n=1 Tax=unclassified Duganella TaxID=2636909 RepID=UPI000E344C0D|nr:MULTISPECIES: paraquat-inducible protein A [unclassified Duganella]RFP23030.1 paraquat-inducible protein A [Duganella sp. BJB489]RFP24893.1 paraquat-inducible protein A [Duganella sp. BJB488]RFP34030.1 paraquat-inducible protein A [Duganella sp. BJB480]